MTHTSTTGTLPRETAWVRASTVALLLLASVLPLAAQEGGPASVQHEVFTGGELEDYLRYAQTLGRVPAHPWSIRGFSPVELDRLRPDSVHPWSERYDFGRGGRFEWVRPRLGVTYNTGFPFGYNDGPVWKGRGLTTELQAGVSLRYGPLSLSLAPVAFRAENEAFELRENGREGDAVFRDRFGRVDLPQRFGDEPYWRVDPGESTLRLDLAGVTVGVSSASQQWGPASAFPLLLGRNAGGFAHAFLGTASPADVWIGRLHGRLTAGLLEQSEYSPLRSGETRRLMTGAAVVFVPRGLAGLEVGAARFFHTRWPEGGIGVDDLGVLFDGLLKERARSDLDQREENQLASVFGRWVLPESGFEMYGEFAREDHNQNLRDFVMEPDHFRAYSLGFRKAWERPGARWAALRGEVASTAVSHLQVFRGGSRFYSHSQLLQGHTHRGQLLGAAPAFGGAASGLAFESFSQAGSWTVEWNRSLREAAPGDEAEGGDDVLHSLGLSGTRFLGGLELTAGLHGVYNLNRHLLGDAFSASLELALRAAI